MVARHTSKKAYEEVLKSGRVETQKETVYNLLKEYGPATQREIEKLYHQITGKESLVRRRFSELEKEGKIKATKEVTCSVSQMSAFAWEADPKNRLISIKPESKHQRIKDLEAVIERVSKAKSLKEVKAILGLDSESYESPVLRLKSKAITDIFE